MLVVIDRDYRILRYNREFADKFAPMPGKFCYKVYKGTQSEM